VNSQPRRSNPSAREVRHKLECSKAAVSCAAMASEFSLAQTPIAYPAYDVLVVRQVCLAVLAPVDAPTVEVRVVCETHGSCSVLSACMSLRTSLFFVVSASDVRRPSLTQVVAGRPRAQKAVVGVMQRGRSQSGELQCYRSTPISRRNS
jgi:hypothetical protein